MPLSFGIDPGKSAFCIAPIRSGRMYFARSTTAGLFDGL